MSCLSSKGWPYLPLRLEQGHKLQYPLFQIISGDLKKGLCIHS